MADSSIEWTDKTWNPTLGCSKVSAGCKNCYAMRMAWRHSHNSKLLAKYGGTVKEQGNSINWTGQINLIETALTIPYEAKKPAKFFVDSMSDLFHEGVPLEYIQRVFQVMNDTPRHIYQVLTKRPENVLKYDNGLNWTPNIWMGVSVEDELVVDRIDLLRNTSAQIKFLSLEPLIGPLANLNLNGIDWAIVGGESGPKARPMKYEWVLDIKNQCQEAGVAFFFKQWGMAQFNPDQFDPTIEKSHENHAKGGCQIDREIFREMPTINDANLSVKLEDRISVLID